MAQVDQNEMKRIAAEKAVETFVKDGMTVGLGTGSTAYFVILKVAELVKQGYKLKCVATSVASENLALENGIPIVDLNDVDHVDVTIDGESLPTCWADGFLVATSSGSTAYSLSVGGPICLPETRVLILAPIAPHNLNIRPIVVPETSVVDLSFRSREQEIMATMDNRNLILPVSSVISVSVAQFSLKTIRLDRSNFIHALKSKLFWGEDVRNL